MHLKISSDNTLMILELERQEGESTNVVNLFTGFPSYNSFRIILGPVKHV